VNVQESLPGFGTTDDYSSTGFGLIIRLDAIHCLEEVFMQTLVLI